MSDSICYLMFGMAGTNVGNVLGTLFFLWVNFYT